MMVNTDCTKILRIFTVILFSIELLSFAESLPQFKPLAQRILKINNSSIETQQQKPSHSNSFENNTNTENGASAGSAPHKKSKTRILFKGNSSRQEISFKDYLEHAIIFPDAYQAILERIPKIEGRPKCAQSGSTFCEQTDLYPHNLVENILKEKEVKNDLFGQDEMSDDDDRYAISNRNGGGAAASTEEKFLCEGIPQTIFPRVAQNKKNKWRLIINQGTKDGYVQGVRIERCRREKEGLPCELVGEIPIGYVTSCKQKYILRRLVTLTEQGDPMTESFPLPSACCCSYRKDVGFLARFGASPQTPTTLIDLL